MSRCRNFHCDGPLYRSDERAYGECSRCMEAAWQAQQAVTAPPLVPTYEDRRVPRYAEAAE